MKLPKEVQDLIAKLAAESGKTEEVLVAELVRRYDEERHVQFVPNKGHLRVMCGYKNCFEKSPRDPSGRD